MSVDEQDKLANEICKLEKKATDATKAHKSAFPAGGKVVCIIEERLNDLKSTKKIASNTSLSTYWESITKTKLNNHALSCAVAFGTYVRTELISEEDYDKNTGQCLELAASISTAAGGDITNEFVHEAAEVLRTVTAANLGNASKKLREILDKVKLPKDITAEKAQEMLARILACGHLTTVVIPAIGAEVAHVKDPEKAKSAFLGLNMALDMFAVNMETVEAIDPHGKVSQHQIRRFDTATIDGWKAARALEIANAKHSVKLTGAPAPVPPAPAPVAPPVVIAPPLVAEVPAPVVAVAEVPIAEIPAPLVAEVPVAASEAPSEEVPALPGNVPFVTKREKRRLAALAEAQQLQAA